MPDTKATTTIPARDHRFVTHRNFTRCTINDKQAVQSLRSLNAALLASEDKLFWMDLRFAEYPSRDWVVRYFRMMRIPAGELEPELELGLQLFHRLMPEQRIRIVTKQLRELKDLSSKAVEAALLQQFTDGLGGNHELNKPFFDELVELLRR